MLTPCYTQPKCPVSALPGLMLSMAGAPVSFRPEGTVSARTYPRRKEASAMLTPVCYAQPKCPALATGVMLGMAGACF